MDTYEQYINNPLVGAHDFVIHFETDDHFLPLDDFIACSESTKIIVEEFNQKFFGGKFNILIVVLPPEEGSFLKQLGLFVSGVAVLIAPDIISGVLRAETGKSTDVIAEQLWIDAKRVTPTVYAKEAADILARATRGFYEKEDRALTKTGFDVDVFSKAYQAKNDFFRVCSGNSDIKGIGFNKHYEFPIQRADFNAHIIDIPEKEKVDIDHEWKTEIMHTKVVSPYWEKAGNHHWKARFGDNQEASFTVDDDAFWKLVESEKLKVKIKDNMKVQWAFIVEKGRRKKLTVLRVLEYNGAKVSSPLTDLELDELLKKHSKQLSNQTDLFDQNDL